jgi:hypothetical protein
MARLENPMYVAKRAVIVKNFFIFFSQGFIATHPIYSVGH